MAVDLEDQNPNPTPKSGSWREILEILRSCDDVDSFIVIIEGLV
ncbi:uncharacterized protein G2W53_042172 [Senna tora]|uniref:Uncharacterized protein n=1 Tax=Senna tora TaxID=362788 RepID=A0A834W245_9FABA|nr:uncharacterized protein G2W53_042172 [Senna tora]